MTAQDIMEELKYALPDDEVIIINENNERLKAIKCYGSADKLYIVVNDESLSQNNI